MSLDFLTNYVVLVVFGTCICAGYIFKGIKRFPNDLIVPLLAIIGVAVNTWLNDWEFTPDKNRGKNNGKINLFKPERPDV